MENNKKNRNIRRDLCGISRKRHPFSNINIYNKKLCGKSQGQVGFIPWTAGFPSRTDAFFLRDSRLCEPKGPDFGEWAESSQAISKKSIGICLQIRFEMFCRIVDAAVFLISSVFCRIYEPAAYRGKYAFCLKNLFR